jgi:hypothetical protein
MKKIILSVCVIGTFSAYAQNQNPENAKMKPEMTEFWDPEVKIITPAENNLNPPSDAIVLFDGTNETLLQNWTNGKGEAPLWNVADNCMTVVKGTGTIKTKMNFEDFQLHIEWRTPAEVNPESKSQGRGNSGIFMQERYELQVLDNYENRTYRNGQAGSFYKQYAPLVNVCKKPGEWQTYDVIYTAPRFKADSTLFTPARVTVLQNGVLVQNNVQLSGPTEYIGIPKYKFHGPGAITLQDHGNMVSYKNIWIREL